MSKFFISIMLLLLPIGAFSQTIDDGYDELIANMIAAKIHQDSIDMSNLVAVYNYECQTQDADGNAVTDSMKLCLQVGQYYTRSYPYRKFREDTENYDWNTPEGLVAFKAEGYCLMPEVWVGYPEGIVTVRDAIPPYIYETREEKKSIKWTLSEDTLTVAGYLCKTATCQIHGRNWTVHFTEDIPVSAGPWKLCGLPGMILEADADGGILHFSIVSIQHLVSPIYYETNAITSKVSNQKLTKMRIKTFGNRIYPKNPRYYFPDNLSRTADVTHTKDGMIINNVFVNHKAHVYQPLELK